MFLSNGYIAVMHTSNVTSRLEALVASWSTEKLRSIWEAHFHANLTTAGLSRKALIADVIWIESHRKSVA